MTKVQKVAQAVAPTTIVVLGIAAFAALQTWLG